MIEKITIGDNGFGQYCRVNDSYLYIDSDFMSMSEQKKVDRYMSHILQKLVEMRRELKPEDWIYILHTIGVKDKLGEHESEMETLPSWDNESGIVLYKEVFNFK
jgi:hypothetical protein